MNAHLRQVSPIVYIMDSPTADSKLVFYVNGKKVEDSDVDPEWTLLYYLRNNLRLCGTKLGCGTGGCGACTVMISSYNHALNKPVHIAARACLMRVAALHGKAVTTVEGIGSTATQLHPVQKRIAEAHGSQCGFCTPGMVMSMYTLLRNAPKPTMEQIENAIRGNLCRCTGYRPIVEGYSSFAIDGQQWKMQSNGFEPIGDGDSCPLGENCCKNKKTANEESHNVTLFNKFEYTPYDASQEPIFPPELQLSSKYERKSLIIKGKRVTWFQPATLMELLILKARYKTKAHIIVGNTKVGLEENCTQPTVTPILIYPATIPELTTINTTTSGIRVGSAVTITELEQELKAQIKKHPEHKTRLFSAIVKSIQVFGEQQIRNVSCVGGNIMGSSPLSDLNPLYMVCSCLVEAHSQARGVRTIIMDQEFFTGDWKKRNIIEDDEIITAVNIPFTKENQYIETFKQSKRQYLDSAVMNMAINVEFKPGTPVIQHIEVAYGGMANKTKLAQKTKEHLLSKNWNEDLLETAYKFLLEDFPLLPGAPGGMNKYRSSLVLSLFFKAFLSINKQLELNNVPNIQHLRNGYESALTSQWNKPFNSSQYFQVVQEDQKEYDPIGRPVVHKSAFKQATGEAIYCDDIPRYENELYIAYVRSTRAHAKILSIDPSKALSMNGVHEFFSAKDLTPQQNAYGFENEEHIFAPGLVTYFGSVIGAIVADNKLLAQQAAKLVQVEYADLDPVIISLEDAIEKQSFLDKPRVLNKGNIEDAFRNCDHQISGEVKIGGQEHFYMETNCALAIPGEDNGMEIICSTQNPNEVQRLVADLIGVQRNKVVCKVKRLGGGFGGKECRPHVMYLPVVFAAFKLRRPVRCMLDRNEDMEMIGRRHPFIAKYKIAFSKEGKLQGCEVEMYCNGGNTQELSDPVMERAVTHIQNSYVVPVVKCTGHKCRSNIASNTVMRGAGSPQGIFFAETMIRDIAVYLNKDPVEICELNMYKEGDLTHFNQVMTNVTLGRCWEECLAQAKYSTKRSNVQDFNRTNRWKKRGLAVIPLTYGVCYTVVHLNQAGALVLVYEDGSVLLTHGGCEMGQGLHTKMIQVAARVLDISENYIYIAETATDKIPNATPTSASVGSDINGMAVKNACEKIVERLKPFKAGNPNGKWKDWVSAAYLARVSLSATGFFKTTDIDYDYNTMSGNLWNYYSFGAACSEVEIDCLTGDHKVLSTDIVMDVGQSLNPAIDIGQVEGGFIQGYGLYVLEELKYSPTGKLLSNGPGLYKIPTVSDIPTVFNVSLLQGSSNPRAVYSSKGIGEPPLMLATSVFFAIKDAIAAARAEVGLSGCFRLDSPATSERIRTACADHIINKIPDENTSCEPWAVFN